MKWDKRGRAQINIGRGGNNTIIPSPGDASLIEIDHINFILIGAENTIILKDGTSVIADYPMPVNSSFTFDNVNPSLNPLALSVGSSFSIAITGVSSSVKGFVLYRITDQ